MILGIDQSLSKTALVITDKNKLIKFKLIKSSTKDLTEIRIKKIGLEIINFIKENNIKEVNIENLPYGAHSRSVRPLAGLFYFILILLNENNIKYKSIEPTVLKKFATKNGKSSKEDMINNLPIEVKEFFNIYLKNKKLGLDDLADAYFLSIYS